MLLQKYMKRVYYIHDIILYFLFRLFSLFSSLFFSYLYFLYCVTYLSEDHGQATKHRVSRL